MTARWEDALSPECRVAGCRPFPFLSAQVSPGVRGTGPPALGMAWEPSTQGKGPGRAGRAGLDAPEGGPPFRKTLEQPVAALFLLDHLVRDDGDRPSDQQWPAGRNCQHDCNQDKRTCPPSRHLMPFCQSRVPMRVRSIRIRFRCRVTRRHLGQQARPWPGRERRSRRKGKACRRSAPASQVKAQSRVPSVASPLSLCRQNSTPACALIPDRNGCFTSVISVTRSAASIRSSFAFRPVKTTWVRGGFSERRNSSTSAMSR